jgi:hypothetical protein
VILAALEFMVQRIIKLFVPPESINIFSCTCIDARGEDG